jgi:hypothetical protein
MSVNRCRGEPPTMCLHLLAAALTIITMLTFGSAAPAWAQGDADGGGFSERPKEEARVSQAESLDKAKKVTAKFETGFVLPPRNISDITELLSLQKERDEGVLGKLQREADRKYPTTKDTGDLAFYYFKRATTAGNLGRGKQAIQDNRKAADLAIQDNLGGSLARFATHNYALDELLYGNYGKGVKGMEELL